MSHPNDPSKMVQTVFQPTRKKSAGVGSFWWKHLGGLLYDYSVICGCAIFIAVFCRVGSVWVGSFLFQWKHGLNLKCVCTIIAPIEHSRNDNSRGLDTDPPELSKTDIKVETKLCRLDLNSEAKYELVSMVNRMD